MLFNASLGCFVVFAVSFDGELGTVCLGILFSVGFGEFLLKSNKHH